MTNGIEPDAAAIAPLETVPYAGISLTPRLQEEGVGDAVTVLRAYFGPITETTGYTGGAWDSFDPSGLRSSCANTFTSDDVLACELLSARVDGRAALQLLDVQRERFEKALVAIGADRDFLGSDVDSVEFQPINKAYYLLRGIRGVGRTRATKLLARKRPRLVPIVDNVIRQVIFNNGTAYWGPLSTALAAHNNALWVRLEELHRAADLDESVTTLRVFDVLAWMDGSGHSDRVLSGAR